VVYIEDAQVQKEKGMERCSLRKKVSFKLVFRRRHPRRAAVSIFSFPFSFSRERRAYLIPAEVAHKYVLAPIGQ
jgi:hypothetical protein